MGQASWNAGFETGMKFTAPKTDEVQIDLPVGCLLNIRFMAHIGFQHMITDEFIGFKNEQDAQNATRNIEHLEFAIPQKYRDESDPYALSFNRQTMIWSRWPKASENPTVT